MAHEIKCRQCGSVVSGSAIDCPKCGFVFDAAQGIVSATPSRLLPLSAKRLAYFSLVFAVLVFSGALGSIAKKTVC